MYYLERNRGAREDLARLPPGGPWDAASDDLAAGLDGLGDLNGAVRVMREKFASQTERGVAEGGLYSTYANLGTFLVHANVHAARSGDAAAKERLREGLDFIRMAIQVKPDAHFGREQWQVATVEFTLAAIEQPDLLRTFDLIGNRLDADIDPTQRRAYSGPNWIRTGEYRYHGLRLERGESIPRDDRLAEHIQHVGAENGWPANLIPSNPKPIPFDEPILGIVGMWRESGANPHFALCLGETMLRVGQRYIAWSAFERASRLADDFWPDATLQQFLGDHCRKRQAMIEVQLPAEEVAHLRPQYDAELDYGRQYQREYGEYEAEQIGAGRPIDDEHFYDAFHAGREPISSPVGPEDELPVVSQTEQQMIMLLPGPRAGYAMLGMGLAGLWMAIWLRRRTRCVDAAPAADL